MNINETLRVPPAMEAKLIMTIEDIVRLVPEEHQRGNIKRKRLSDQPFLILAKRQFMEEIFVEDKQKFLDEQPPPFGGYDLTEKVRCLHCGEVVTVGDYKIFKEEGDDFLYIYCPNAPKCNGTIIDWVPPDANR